MASIGADVPTARLDVADLAAIEPVVATLAERLGRLDVVFANAGIGREASVGSTPIALFEEIVRGNLTAVFFTAALRPVGMQEGVGDTLHRLSQPPAGHDPEITPRAARAPSADTPPSTQAGVHPRRTAPE